VGDKTARNVAIAGTMRRKKVAKIKSEPDEVIGVSVLRFTVRAMACVLNTPIIPSPGPGGEYTMTLATSKIDDGCFRFACFAIRAS